MKNIAVALTCGVVAAGAITTVATPVRAQDTPAAGATTSFPDIPANHWAYQAVSDLAAKGYVKGYPDGDFLGQRALTRYEFATVLSRMLATINDLATKVNTPAPPQTPTGNFATVDDLNKIQALVDEFKKELDDVKTNTSQLQDQLDAIRQDILDTKALVAKAQATANNSYGTGAGRKFVISGYIQARYQMADSSDKTRFPQGVAAQTGAGQVNGNYAQGGTKETFFDRRSRLKITGEVTDYTKYAFQIDAAGFTTNTTTPNNVSVREGNITYAFSGLGKKLVDKDVAGLAATIGLWANYFGYELPLSSADILSPERPLAFNEGGVGLFPSQDYERGAQLTYGMGVTKGTTLRLTGGVVNGTGLNGNDNNNHLDEIYRVGLQSADKTIGVGASYYDGEIARPASGSTTFTGPNYEGGKKQLFGADARYATPFGFFVNGEYVDGKFEQRTFFSGPTATATTTVFAPGNKVQGYYVQGGWSLFNKTARPLTFGVSYDVFQRSKSGVGADDGVTGGASGSTFDDKNLGYGVLYNLDKQTRLRVWYTAPDKIAHAAGTVDPPKIGLLTTEVEVKF